MADRRSRVQPVLGSGVRLRERRLATELQGRCPGRPPAGRHGRPASRRQHDVRCRGDHAGRPVSSRPPRRSRRPSQPAARDTVSRSSSDRSSSRWPARLPFRCQTTRPARRRSRGGWTTCTSTRSLPGVASRPRRSGWRCASGRTRRPRPTSTCPRPCSGSSPGTAGCGVTTGSAGSRPRSRPVGGIRIPATAALLPTLLRSISGVTDLGMDTVAGQTAHRYRGRVDVAVFPGVIASDGATFTSPRSASTSGSTAPITSSRSRVAPATRTSRRSTFGSSPGSTSRTSPAGAAPLASPLAPAPSASGVTVGVP